MTTNEIQIKSIAHGRSAFVIEDETNRLAEMEFSVKNGVMTVYHTEVAKELKGQGVATRLLDEMVAYARNNKVNVVPLCPFVHAQFKRNPKKYEDIWLRK